MSCLIFVFVLSISGIGVADVDLDVHGGARVAYDDNITFRDNDTISDIITSLNVGAGIKTAGPKHDLSAVANVSHHIYRENSTFDNTSFDFKLVGKADSSERDHLKVVNSYIHADEPRSFEDAFGRLNGRYSYDHNRFDLGYRRELNSQLSVNSHYGQNISFYSRKDLSDSVKHILGGGTEFAINSRHIVGLGYDYTKQFFTPGSEISVHSLFGTYRYYLTKQLYLDVKAGNDFIEIEDGDGSNHLRTEISLTSDVDEVTKAGISFKKGIATSSYSQDLFDSYEFSAKWARQLTNRIDSYAVGFYGDGEYSLTKIHNRFFGAGMGANYALSPNAKVGLQYSYSEIQSNEETSSYQKNYVQIGTQVYF